MGPLDLDGVHDPRDVICEELRGVGSSWLVGLTGAPQVNGDAREVLRVLSHLERIAGLVRGQVRDKHDLLSRAGGLVIDVDVARSHGWHADPSPCVQSERRCFRVQHTLGVCGWFRVAQTYLARARGIRALEPNQRTLPWIAGSVPSVPFRPRRLPSSVKGDSQSAERE